MGPYDYVRELGRGSFGAVWLAVDRETGLRVAIKLLLFESEDARLRFQREARLLYAEMHNPHVVRLLDHDLWAEHPFIVLEYCEQGSLRRWVGRDVPWRDVASAVLHALEGLAQLHAHGGFHRDLKPDNLLMGTDPATGQLVIKVADFGLARHPVSRTGPMTRSALGTDGYIAPEVLVGGEFSTAADIYSLGITLVELLTGSRRPTALERAKCPLGLISLTERMVSRDPAHRPPAEDVAASLVALLSHPRMPDQVAASQASGRVGLLVVAGTLAALAMLANDGAGSWDPKAARYRGSDGQFRRE